MKAILAGKTHRTTRTWSDLNQEHLNGSGGGFGRIEDVNSIPGLSVSHLNSVRSPGTPRGGRGGKGQTSDLCKCNTQKSIYEGL
jgi:hypothetical protein